MNKAGRKPLYLQIQQDLHQKIRTAQLRHGDFLPTRSELATQYNTTAATVNRALQDLIQQGVVSSSSGRRTSVVAAHLQQDLTIAVVWSTPEDQVHLGKEFFGPLMEGVRQACAELSVEVLFRQCSATAYGGIVSETRARGLLVFNPYYSDKTLLARINAEGIPVVAVPGILGKTGIPFVASDHFSGMQQAVNYLVGLGHRDIAFTSLTVTVPDHFERLQGYLAAMTRNGLPILPNRIYIDSDVDGADFAATMGRWLKGDDLPTAVITADFLLALALMRRFKETGVRVPEDVSLIHFDDPPAASHLHPTTTGIRQHTTELGYEAVQHLVHLIRQEPVVSRKILTTELVVRESTAPPSR